MMDADILFQLASVALVIVSFHSGIYRLTFIRSSTTADGQKSNVTVLKVISLHSALGLFISLLGDWGADVLLCFRKRDCIVFG